jgi:adenylate cyclase
MTSPEPARLSAAELAGRAAVPEEELRRLVDVGLLAQAKDGTFAAADLTRIRLAEALDRSGIPLQEIGAAIRRGELSLDFLAELWPDPVGFVPDTTIGRFAEEHGLPWELIESSRVRLGLPRPRRDEPIREDDAVVFPSAAALLGAGLNEAAIVRFSRVMGEHLRLLAEAQVRFFDDAVMGPMLDSGVPEQQAWDLVAGMGSQLSPTFEQILVWLYRRHQEHALFEDIVEHMEQVLERSGRHESRASRPQAIVFLDLTGFTRLTEEQGDEAAADLAARLALLAQEASSARGGTPVKLLGDGVMFHFREPAQAVASALDMVTLVVEADLPPAHVGINAGPVVFREGDYFGRTVNVAARIAAKAGPGEVLASEAAMDAVDDPEVAFEPVGKAELKGVPEPMALYRVVRAAPTADSHSDTR